MSFLKWFNPLTFINYVTPTLLGTIASGMGIASGLSSIFGGGSGGASGSQMGGTIYDPFGGNRAASGQALMNLMQGRPLWGGGSAVSGGTSGSGGGSLPTSDISPSGLYMNRFSGEMLTGKQLSGMGYTLAADKLHSYTPMAGTPPIGGSKPSTSSTTTSTSYSPSSAYGSLTSDPSYQWRYNTGLDAIQRTLAAQGVGLSGGALSQLQSYGQGMASQEFSNEFSRLAAMAGVGSWSGSNLGQMQANQQQMGWGALAQGLGGLSQSGIFGGGGSGGYMSGESFSGMTPNAGINWGGSTGGMDFSSASSPWNLSGGTLGGLF